MSKSEITTKLLIAMGTALGLASAFLTNADAQRRDYLTDAEVELVRDAQQIDLRVAVLMTAVDRRLGAIERVKVNLKDESKWGPAPEGTRLELIRDVENLVRKAVDDVDDVASRNADSEFFPKAVFKFASSCEALTPRLKSLLDSSKEDKERGSITSTADRCRDVIEAAARLPKETKPAPKKKS